MFCFIAHRSVLGQRLILLLSKLIFVKYIHINLKCAKFTRKKTQSTTPHTHRQTDRQADRRRERERERERGARTTDESSHHNVPSLLASGRSVQVRLIY